MKNIILSLSILICAGTIFGNTPEKEIIKELLIRDTMQRIDNASEQCSITTNSAIKEKKNVVNALIENTAIELMERENTLDAIALCRIQGEFMQKRIKERYEATGCTSKSSDQDCKELTKKLEMLTGKIATMIKALNEYEDMIKQLDIIYISQN